MFAEDDLKEADIDQVLQRVREALRTVEYGKVTIEVNAENKTTGIAVERREKIPKR